MCTDRKTLNHRQLLAQLTPDERKDLTRKSNSPGLVHLTVHWCSILVTASLIHAQVPFWPALVIVQGVLIIFQFTLLHEAIHQTPFATKWINSLVARITGFMLLLPADWFRYFHFEHHRHTQDPNKDPELLEEKPESMIQYARHISGIPVLWSQIKTVFRNATGCCDDKYVPLAGRRKVQKEARIMLLGYSLLTAISLMLGSTALLLVWILPLLAGQPFLRLYLLAEHGRCAFVSNMFENTRTTYTNLLMRRLAWNMPYHAEHHAFPAVPYYRLPEFHHLVQQNLQVTADGYGVFHRDYIRGFKLK